MRTLKSKIALFFFLALFSTSTIISCGTKSTTEEQQTEEHPEGEHPADSSEHPSEHPSDSTGN